MQGNDRSRQGTKQTSCVVAQFEGKSHGWGFERPGQTMEVWSVSLNRVCTRVPPCSDDEKLFDVLGIAINGPCCPYCWPIYALLATFMYALSLQCTSIFVLHVARWAGAIEDLFRVPFQVRVG